MKALATTALDSRPDRAATQLLHDEENARIVSFHLLPDQHIAPHSSDSTVVVQVVEGEGFFKGAGDEIHLVRGDAAVFAPGEMHSMRPAGGGALRFLAIITPRPR